MGISLPLGARVGVLELFGSIESSNVTSYVNIVNKLRKSPRIKSVILNIDSGGGLHSAADYLYITVCKLSAEKPVIAFISCLGTSGAYLVSCAATKIVALPNAEVGSIGVTSTRRVLQELLQKIGVHVTVTKAGRLKDLGSPYRELTEEEKRKEQEHVDSFYNYFIRAVAKGRHIDEKTVRELATGEVFLGEKAKALGLVDEIGDFDTALDIAAQLGKVPRRFTCMRPRRALLEKLLSRFAASFSTEIFAKVEHLITR